jgi:uncharacterized membrane protein
MHHFNWTPGIGDPTIGGWVTVVLYALAAASCWITGRGVGSREKRIWWIFVILFVVLGLNKQLDLQSALTEAGRVLAANQGWYARRKIVQLDFVIAVAICGLIAVVTLLIWARKAPLPTWLALTGVTLVIGFVLIRAASFHHIDRFIHMRILGLRWNWVLEMGGISMVLVASFWRRHRPLPATKAARRGS